MLFFYIHKKNYTFLPKILHNSNFCSNFVHSFENMVCTDIHNSLAKIVSRYDPNQVCCVADEVFSTSSVLNATLSGIKCLLIPVAESEKSLETVQRVWDFFFEMGLTRKGLVIAVGGGALTDLVGFCAATYKRGVDCLYIPTTLLAMVDAAIGGKTGFNYHALKNSIGVFQPPVETLISPQWLRTLPADQFLSGYAEMLKTGSIGNPSLICSTTVHWTLDQAKPFTHTREGIKNPLWNELLRYDLDTMPLADIHPLIERCVAAKEQIVKADPQEEGLRKVLNFGHTFGHALEEISLSANEVTGLSAERSLLSQRSGLLHGYAVLYGMIAELYLSVTKLGCPKEALQHLTRLMLHYYGRPSCKCSDRSRLISLMQQDKKNEHAAQINCTLIRSVGDPVINQIITPQEAEEALDYLFSL